MTLHVFNPEHDIALASGLRNFTSPHAGRQLRHDLGWIPALWCDKDDVVLVDDVATAQHKSACFGVQNHRFCSSKVALLKPESGTFVSHVSPWGWDAALHERLKRMGVDVSIMPDEHQLSTIRALSHRRTSMSLLPELRTDDTVGEAFECTSLDAVAAVQERYGHIVVKAPWSSSGRGVRFTDKPCDEHMSGWLRNVISQQGSVMAEPYYNKVKDFAMEFTAHADGSVSYDGLSLFHTKNGSYTGNILATEGFKRERLSHYLPLKLIDSISQTVCQRLPMLLAGKYCGPLGIDMMVVGTEREGFLLHPCVEINLRNTMGHVALLLSERVNPQHDDDIVRVMRIIYTNHYELKIQKL